MSFRWNSCFRWLFAYWYWSSSGEKKKTRNNNMAGLLGLKLIQYCASKGNPTGVNKQAALLESNEDDYYGAVQLYESCVKSGRINALLLFNLGWSLVNGQGVDRKDVSRGISLWKEAVSLAPDEGSEEAAWCLYEEYKRDDPKEADKWFGIAMDLGYEV
mmetsp:Transcript_1551/g.2306  ORF Transcript_1551/g.2306 Transcript_1551/m.2306 type:complete len:159 (+) Transcript_1551:581-1057(+)